MWRFYLIMRTADRAIIGDAGFKGPPDREGTIEIAYGVVPDYRRQGYAFEAAQALVNWAFSRPEVVGIIARCDDDNVGSIRILEKLGMRRTGIMDRVLLWQVLRDPG